MTCRLARLAGAARRSTARPAGWSGGSSSTTPARRCSTWQATTTSGWPATRGWSRARSRRPAGTAPARAPAGSSPGRSRCTPRSRSGWPRFTGFATGLVLSTGYHANLAVVAALADRDTLVVSDAHVHASMVDACRLARARVAVVPHNDVAAVEAALAAWRGRRAGARRDRLLGPRGPRPGRGARRGLRRARRAARRRRGPRARGRRDRAGAGSSARRASRAPTTSSPPPRCPRRSAPRAAPSSALPSSASTWSTPRGRSSTTRVLRRPRREPPSPPSGSSSGSPTGSSGCTATRPCSPPPAASGASGRGHVGPGRRSRRGGRRRRGRRRQGSAHRLLPAALDARRLLPAPAHRPRAPHRRGARAGRRGADRPARWRDERARVVVVTGTDTGVGKTVVTAALAAAYAGQGRSVCVVKPAQTGVGPDEPGDLEEVRRLAGPVDHRGAGAAARPAGTRPRGAGRRGRPAGARGPAATWSRRRPPAHDVVLSRERAA